MNTRYVIPIAVALAAHGGLLFGFTKSSRPDKHPIEKKDYIPFPLPPLPDLPELVEVISTEPAAKKSDDLQPPKGEEPPSIIVDVTVPTMPRPPITTGPVVNTDFIPKDFSDGMEDGKGPLRTFITGLELDNAPRARFQAAPIYPFEQKKNGQPGEVYVDFVVDEAGMVHSARVTKSSDRVFEEPTLRAVAKWRFEPGKRNGKIVSFRMTVPVVFSLND